jgi:hypothetical protein
MNAHDETKKLVKTVLVKLFEIYQSNTLKEYKSNRQRSNKLDNK